MRLRLIHLAALLVLALTTLAYPAQAESVVYSKEDLSTVRVLAVGGASMRKFVAKKGKRRGQHFSLALPRGGHGSGVLITDDGVIVTAAHVVDDAEFVAVRVPGRTQALMAQVIYENEMNDVAFLKVAGSFKNFIPIPDVEPQVHTRQRVFALGYPLDASRKYPQSSMGAVAGTMATGELQLSISVNPGNSGGPLISESGELLGAVLRSSDSSQGVQGIGVAVPIGVLQKFWERRVKGAPLLKRARQDFASLMAESAAAEFVAEVASVSSVGAALDHIESRKGLSKWIKKSLKTHKQSADYMALVSAHYWNVAVAELVLGGPDAAKAQARSKMLAAHALKLDASVKYRSPFLYQVLGLKEPRQSSAGKEFPTPRRLGGFRLGWSIARARDACEIEGLEFSGEERNWGCSEVPAAESITGPVRLRFCQGSLCRIDLIHRPSRKLSEEWASELVRLRSYLDKKYGKHQARAERVSSECKKAILPCLKKGTAKATYRWSYPVARLDLTMRRIENRPTIRVTLRDLERLPVE